MSKPAARRRPGLTPAASPDAFGAAYYRRFYEDPRTRVGDRAAVRKLAGFVAAYLTYLDVPVRRILDLGCGVGHWRDAAAKLWPQATYLGVEYSRYLCERFGWQHGSAADFAPTGRHGEFDLVICQGVLQYLDDDTAARAITNFGRLCRGALYLEALTRLDWEQNCDRSVTDGDVHLRPGDWYRRRLATDFQDCGGSVFTARRAGVPLFELEGS
ncbi:MAG: class I SAM-dependent methyltransferase [Planctomycetes bacterium]|nr:class I SAM-dependent methyltransferase [Planctomycetota bacterium]MCB9886786.1 class I SAM-dependent methyltransferase [Planctomycetota bacterium]